MRISKNARARRTINIQYSKHFFFSPLLTILIYFSYYGVVSLRFIEVYPNDLTPCLLAGWLTLCVHVHYTLAAAICNIESVQYSATRMENVPLYVVVLVRISCICEFMSWMC